MDNVAKEKMSDVERDALRTMIATRVMAAMYSQWQGAMAPTNAEPEAEKLARQDNAALDVWRAARAVDAANFLMAELELTQITERVVFEEGDSALVSPPSAMKCVHGMTASEPCPLCDDQNERDMMAAAEAAELAERVAVESEEPPTR